MNFTTISCSWCQTRLEDALNLDIEAIGWKVYQHHSQLCPECCIKDSRLGKYAYSSYFAFPGEVIFIANYHATVFIEKKFVREISLKDLRSIFDDIENGKLHKTNDKQHDEVRWYFGQNCLADHANTSVEVIRKETNKKIEAELKTKNLPSGKDANIAAVRKMLGMATNKKAGQ